jgi:hypothetical protein
MILSFFVASTVIPLEGYLPSYEPSKQWHFNHVQGNFSYEGFSYTIDIRGPRRTDPNVEKQAKEEISRLFFRIFPENFTLSPQKDPFEFLTIIASGIFPYGDSIFTLDVKGKSQEQSAKIIELLKARLPKFTLDSTESFSKIHKLTIEEQMVVPPGKSAKESHLPGELNAFLPLHMGGTLRNVCERFVDLYVHHPSASLRLDGNPILSEVDVLRKAVAMAPKEGVYLDFGFGTARSSNEIARQAYPPHAIYAFDSGTGSPTPWNRQDKQFPAGLFAFKLDEKGRLKLPFCDENVFLSLGLFQEELPKLAKALTKDRKSIAFMCIDCETYESTQCIFEVLSPFLMDKAILYFDEIQNFEGWEEGHEHLALMELMRSLNSRQNSNQRWTIELVAFNPHHQQAAFQLNVKNQRIKNP